MIPVPRRIPYPWGKRSSSGCARLSCRWNGAHCRRGEGVSRQVETRDHPGRGPPGRAQRRPVTRPLSRSTSSSNSSLSAGALIASQARHLDRSERGDGARRALMAVRNWVRRCIRVSQDTRPEDRSMARSTCRCRHPSSTGKLHHTQSYNIARPRSSRCCTRRS